MVQIQDVLCREHLADCLRIKTKQLTYILYVKNTENCYSTFEIPKRSGGVRVIAAPNNQLKTIQKRLARLLQDYHLDCWEEKRNRIPNISHAFEPRALKRGIISNAKIHRKKRYVLNIDLTDFFGTIHFGRVKGYFEKNNDFKMSSDVATMIAQLCCYKGVLPQGAPTSPILSNLICEILDYRLLKTAKKYKLDYTRYADDLTFSTNDKHFLESFNNAFVEIKSVIERAGFAINEKKTRLQYRDSRQIVTGLVVNQKLSVANNYYKDTRAMAHSLYKTGEFYIEGKKGNMNQLEGRFSFIYQIDKQKDDPLQKKTAKLSSRKMQFSRFLFYKHFFANEMPLIVTEGKTDPVYLKAALRGLHDKYPTLVERNDDGSFVYKVKFLKRSEYLQALLKVNATGADTMIKVFNLYNGSAGFPDHYHYLYSLTQRQPQHPVILLFDNELSDKNKPLYKFITAAKKDNHEKAEIEETIKSGYSACLIQNSNLYLATHQLVGGKDSCEIEDLFDEETQNHVIDGKTFSRDENYDRKTNYGKDTFSKYVIASWESIDFSGFEVLLDTISGIIEKYPNTTTQEKA